MKLLGMRTIIPIGLVLVAALTIQYVAKLNVQKQEHLREPNPITYH